MKGSIFIVAVMMGLASSAWAGGGDWAPAIVCETQDHNLNVAWSYLQKGESLIGRELDIQLQGEDEGLPYLVTSSHNTGNIVELSLTARSSWPGTVFPLGPAVSISLDKQWKYAVLIGQDGTNYNLKCGN